MQVGQRNFHYSSFSEAFVSTYTTYVEEDVLRRKLEISSDVIAQQSGLAPRVEEHMIDVGFPSVGVGENHWHHV